ncbi:MAG: MFS transporter, partial [Chloroflexota bacterium]
MMNRTQLASAACYASFLPLGISATLFGPTLPSLTQRYHVLLEDGGVFTSVQFFGALLSIIVAGRLLDRINARYLLIGGPLLLGSGLVLLGAATSLPLALLATLLFGIGFGVLDVSANYAIVQLHPVNSSAPLNLLNAVRTAIAADSKG